MFREDSILFMLGSLMFFSTPPTVLASFLLLLLLQTPPVSFTAYVLTNVAHCGTMRSLFLQHQELLGTKGIATRSKDATRSSWPYC